MKKYYVWDGKRPGKPINCITIREDSYHIQLDFPRKGNMVVISKITGGLARIQSGG